MGIQEPDELVQGLPVEQGRSVLNPVLAVSGNLPGAGYIQTQYAGRSCQTRDYRVSAGAEPC